ncbi:M20/M25/M40 family metallo-hydrolase [Streptomyces sp. NPDC006997]|uniref:M20/M25/M40 family metallo-hydrolase n=1 Tax=Streptomyces sp. NPDC006997 TaxID=3155356 RepID=UPI0033E4D92F
MTAAVRRRPSPRVFLALARDRLPRFLDDLAELVGVDSGSHSPDGVNRVAALLTARLDALGFEVERVTLPDGADGQRFGDALVARRAGALPAAQGGRRVLLLGHMDTVFEDGTAAERPFTIRGGRAHGPGVSDDKGGLLAGLLALDLLRAAGVEAYREVVLLATPDEEIGSPASRPLTERLAAESDVALALECARENGDLVCARKGVADFRVTVTGTAAHAGIEPERGANAALAAAHLVVAFQALNGNWDGVTVNVGVIRAGTRANIVCPEAELRVEVRSATAAGIDAARAALDAAASRPVVPGTRARVEQLDFCPPLEPSPGVRRLLATARELGAELGVPVRATATGGVGDANFVAGVGIPVLDGLGPVGGADHTPEEWLDLTTVRHRAALLAALVARLGDDRG